MIVKYVINKSLNQYSSNKTLPQKMGSRSPNSNQLLSLSQWYIYASSEKIYPLVQKIFVLQDYDLEAKVTKD